jgi:cytosine/adenosine deaminase-related metal-dependent hydrolase
METGPQSVIQEAARFGIQTPVPPYPSIYIGSAGVVPLELISAYSAFATMGTRVVPNAIERVEDRNGRVLWAPTARTETVMDSALSWLMLDGLRDVVRRGTAAGSVGSQFTVPAGGKTGTTNDYADVWFVGFTPDLVAGIWIGMDAPERIMDNAQGGRRPGMGCNDEGRLRTASGAGGLAASRGTHLRRSRPPDWREVHSFLPAGLADRGVLPPGHRAQGVLPHPQSLGWHEPAAQPPAVTGRCRRYAADWVVPIAAAPVRDGAVLLDPSGRILEVGPSSSVPVPDGTLHRTFPGAAILPGLVNAHTHLELTGLDGQVPDDEFPDWILHLVALKRARSPATVRAAARQGIEESWRGGVTTVADTGDSGAVIEALAELGASGIAYHEVFGPDPMLADECFAAWAARLGELARFAGGRVRLGASPHAPFTVSGPLYRLAAGHARGAGLPLAMHIAESREESELLATGRGDFATRWRDRGIGPVAAGVTPIEWLERHGVLGPDALCIHCVQATEDDLVRLAAHGAAIAHCPRSNRRHGHGDAPLQAIRSGPEGWRRNRLRRERRPARPARRSPACPPARRTFGVGDAGAGDPRGSRRHRAGAGGGSLEPGWWGISRFSRSGPTLTNGCCRTPPHPVPGLTCAAQCWRPRGLARVAGGPSVGRSLHPRRAMKIRRHATILRWSASSGSRAVRLFAPP